MDYLKQTALQLAEDAALQLPPQITYEQLETMLAEKLEQLIANDFQQFVLLLYKVDVSETKIRDVLAADLSPHVYRRIAALIIERQEQKIIFRHTFTRPAEDDDEEKW